MKWFRKGTTMDERTQKIFYGILFTIILLIVQMGRKNAVLEKNKQSHVALKALASMILFVPLLYFYYYVVGLIVWLPLVKTMGAQSVGWVYMMIIAMIFSPILTVLTIIGLFFKKWGRKKK